MPNCTAQEQAGYWDQFKNKLSSITYFIRNIGTFLTNKYQQYGLALPRRIGIENFESEKNGINQFFAVYSYDTSKDTNAVKDLRKELDLSGIYMLPGSDLELYSRLHPTKPLPQNLSDCMHRLLTECMNSGVAIFHNKPREKLFTQLLWELEDSLPETFDKDETGDEFIKFGHQMFPSLSINDSDQRKGLAYFFTLWRILSYRFSYNKGLLAAEKRLLSN